MSLVIAILTTVAVILGLLGFAAVIFSDARHQGYRFPWEKKD